MARKVLVSRSGLTRCPSCESHIKVAAEIGETTCPFCETALQTSLDDGGSSIGAFGRVARAGRSGILAASLFGLAVAGPMAGCSEEEPNPGEDAASDTASDMNVQPLYGAPADTTGGDVDNSDVQSDTNATDTQPQALYGAVPADTIEPSDTTEADQADDAGAQPLYGAVPADATDGTG